MTLRIAQLKLMPQKRDLKQNADALIDVLPAIAAERPDVLITPECFHDGYCANLDDVSETDMADYAIDVQTDPTVAILRAWAKANSCWVIFGCSRRASEGVYNSALIINRGGELTDIYDKTHLQAHDKKYQPGKHLNVYESNFGKFGVMICADRRWPETVRTMVLKGARIIFNPTYGMHGDLNLAMMRTRAYESDCFIAFTHPQQALITKPSGEVACNVEDDDVLFAVTEIDLFEVQKKADRPGSHIKDRRADLYL